MVAVGAAGRRPDTSAILAARQALARANAVVDQDRANHSPGCVAVDQKLVDRAETNLSLATGARGGVLNLAA